MKRDEIKAEAIKMIKKSGLINLTRAGLSAAVGIPDGSFPHVMGCNFTEFIAELREEKVEEGIAPVSKKRTSPELRKEQILNVAIEMSIEESYQKITRDGVAERAGISFSLVTRYFGTMCQLKREVMRAAIKREIPSIVAQGLGTGDKRAKNAPAVLKDMALALLGA